MSKPLEGIRVLDFSHALAGPFCTYHLGLLGADVIKVERPGVGDDFRHYTQHPGLTAMSAPFIAANAGKRSIAMNLKGAAARDVLSRLIGQSDVLVENFRPDVPKKLGIDFEAASRTNPRLIYCSITGFGQIGPLRDWPAYDHIVQAISGVMMVNGEPDTPPLKVGIPISDTFAGFLSAYAIMAAIIQRGATGKGQSIDVSMLDATLVMMAQVMAGTALSGEPPRRTGNRGFRLVATSDTYATRDGFLAVGANHQHQVEAFFRCIGAEHLLADPRFATDAARTANNDAMRSELESILAGLSADELEPKLAAAQVPASRVRSVTEIIDHPHVREREAMIEARLPGGKSTRIVGAGFRFGHDGPSRSGAVPKLGEHGPAILAELGYGPDEVARLARELAAE